LRGHKRYTGEFKRGAVFEVIERGYSVQDIAQRLEVCTKSLYNWIKHYHHPDPIDQNTKFQSDEICGLKTELLQVTEERDILNKPD